MSKEQDTEFVEEIAAVADRHRSKREGQSPEERVAFLRRIRDSAVSDLERIEAREAERKLFAETPEFLEAELKGLATQDYFMAMQDRGAHIQDILMSREEFIQCKRFLALRRGILELELDEAYGSKHRMTSLEALRALDGVDSHEAVLLAAALPHIRGDRGCHTPVEAFVASILRANAFEGLTPEAAKDSLETFREDAEWICEVVRDLPKKHPQLFPPDKETADAPEDEA